jgi:hypothetical protein
VDSVGKCGKMMGKWWENDDSSSNFGVSQFQTTPFIRRCSGDELVGMAAYVPWSSHNRNPWNGYTMVYQGLGILPSGKRLHNYGKPPFFIGKSTINGPFSIAMLVYQRVSSFWHPQPFPGFCQSVITISQRGADGKIYREITTDLPWYNDILIYYGWYTDKW